MKQWNDFDYETQKKILDMLEDLLLEQDDINTQDAMVAAIVELEVWSNRPCPVIDEPEQYVAIAADPFPQEN